MIALSSLVMLSTMVSAQTLSLHGEFELVQMQLDRDNDDDLSCFQRILVAPAKYTDKLGVDFNNLVPNNHLYKKYRAFIQHDNGHSKVVIEDDQIHVTDDIGSGRERLIITDTVKLSRDHQTLTHVRKVKYPTGVRGEEFGFRCKFKRVN